MSGAAIAAAAAGAAVSGGIGAASSGKGGKKSSPQKELQFSEDAANRARMADRFNVVTPTGSVTWDQGSNTQHTNLTRPQWDLYNAQTEAQQRAVNTALQQSGNLQRTLAAPLDKGDMAQRQRVESAMMDRMNPYLERDQLSLEQRLANQGLQPGGEAYTNAMMDQGRRVNDARLGVIGQGTQEMQATQNMSNAARNQALAENAALMQQSGQVNMPSYTGNSGQGMGVPDAGGIYRAYQNQQNASANQFGGALSGLGDAISKALLKK